MKYHVEIGNSLQKGTPDNVHIYSMFEAQDSPTNMMKVWYPTYHTQVKAIQMPDFRLEYRGASRHVKVFLGGDYHFLDDNLGESTTI